MFRSQHDLFNMPVKGRIKRVGPPGTMAGRTVFSSASCARPFGLPPRMMSVPRPAMFVAIVIKPGTPACPAESTQKY